MKSLIAATLALTSITTFSADLNQFFVEELSTKPCVGHGRLWMQCENKAETLDLSRYFERELSEAITSSITAETKSLECRYTYSFQGNWCEVNGSFTLNFENGQFQEATQVRRYYWAE